MREIIIEKTTGKVLRWGYCDFANDDMFNPDVEEIILSDFVFPPGIDEQIWYWNGTTFQKTAP